MKLIQQLLEMAKSRTARTKQKKRRIKKKSTAPAANATRNLAALGAQTTGAGFHGNEFTKEKKGKAARRDVKKSIRKELDY